ncbi:MAG: substrate-binding domain-containing protein [Opitutus sp.]|nr:substrate-binding domain-containing protein [Opitutus sp.]
MTNDQCSVVRLAMQRLMAAGYRRIGFVMHRGWDHSVDHLWTAGFLCEQSHLDPSDRIPMLLFPDLHPVEAWMNESNSHKVVPQTMLKRWLDEYQPEVIISKASFVEEPLAALGVRCPRDLSLVDVFLEDFSGKMAGVRQNHETVGALAIEILAGQLYHNKFGVPEIPTTTFVEGTWFDGMSCPMPYMPKPRRAARAAIA